MVNKITKEDDDIYKFDELLSNKNYLHFKLNNNIIECSIVYMQKPEVKLSEMDITKIYEIDIASKKNWATFLKYLDKFSSNKKFFYGYLYPDGKELFFTYPYDTRIGARLTLTHIVGDFANKEEFEISSL